MKRYKVQSVEQKEVGYCGPATVSMLFSVYGVQICQDTIMELIGIPRDKRVDGTRVDQLTQAVLDLNINYVLLAKYNSTVNDLEILNREYRLPIGIEWQGSFTEPSGAVYEEGHYSVVVNTNSETSRLTIIDPETRSVFKNGVLRFDQLINRWWDVNQIPFSKNGTTIMKEIYNEGLIFIVVPNNIAGLFTPLGYQVGTIDLMKANEKKPRT